MRKMMAAYWHKDGVDIYSYSFEKPAKFASGALEDLHPVKRGFGRKVLIVGRDRLMHLRKRYPPAPKEKLVKAVDLEIGEIFPFSSPAFYCRIFRSISNYVELDIWAWETDAYAKLKEIFPFSYAVPEDVLFMAGDPEVRVFAHRSFIHMLAHAQGGFLDSASFPLDGFDERQIDRFLLNLSQGGEEIKRITIYGLPQIPVKVIPGPELVRIKEMIYPPCMDRVPQMELRDFKVKGEYAFVALPQPALVIRICLYLALGYVLSLFLTMKNYDRESAEIRQRITAMNKKEVTQAALQPTSDYSDVVREINARLRNGQAPLKIMNMLAQKLPPGSYINRIVLTEDNLEIQVSSREPLAVVKSLGTGENVKIVMIKGAPSQNRGTAYYTFAVNLELAK